MKLSKLTYQFIEKLQLFDYTLSGFDSVWKVLFKTIDNKWSYLHISKYKKTFYIHSIINEELGSLEVVPQKSISVTASNVFSNIPSSEPDDEVAKDWTQVMIAANKWLSFCSKNWIKANMQTQKEYPLEYRYGLIPSSLIKASMPKSFRLDEAVGKTKTKRFVRLAEEGYFLNERNHIVESMTAAEYFKYCKIAYLAAATKKEAMDKTLSGRKMYQRFADGRHEGLLDIDPNSEREFADWLDGKHPKKANGGHPWEIKRGGSFTHIGLRIQRPSYLLKTGYKIKLYGNSNSRLPETIKMFLAIHKAGLPICIAEPDAIRKRLLNQDNCGIIPSYESLNQANQHFLPEEDVYDTFYYNDLNRYKKRLTPFIRWEALPLLKPKTLL